jgi:hypothetical protein
VTVEAWIKTNSVSTQQGIIERYGQSPGADGGYALRLTSEGKLMCFTLRNNLEWDFVQGGTVISTGVWHHVAGVFDGHELRVYVDGELDGSKLSTFSPVSGTTGVKIGARADDGAFAFNGLIDEARITAATLYCATFTPPPTLRLANGTRGLWIFDGQTTNDYSQYGNNGSPIGSASFSTDVPY